jgi:TonB family protein
LVFWFNPLVYKFKYFLDEVHEYEADELSCSNTDEYLLLLLKQNFEVNSLQLIHQFNANHLKSRIMRIKNSKRKIGVRTMSTAIILLGLLFIGNQTLFAQSDKTYKNIAEGEMKEVDKEAEYPGGQEALMTYIAERTKYPKVAKGNNVEGTVFVQFIIEKDGSVGRKKILRGVKNGELLDEAALAAFDNMPNWTPAEKDGKKVATSMVIPIKFVLPPPPPPAPPTPPNPTN